VGLDATVKIADFGRAQRANAAGLCECVRVCVCVFVFTFLQCVCSLVRLSLRPVCSRAAQRERFADAVDVAGGAVSGCILACVGRLGVRRRAVGDLLLRQNSLRCVLVLVHMSACLC
jgi:hypothetical protein